jgi:excisionase family DNA binding protein
VEIDKGGLYTLYEVAKRAKLSARTIFNYANAGVLSTVRMGRGQRVTGEELERFLSEGADRRGTGAPPPKSGRRGPPPAASVIL